MNEELYRQKRQIRDEKRKIVIKGIMILTMCIITFFAGRASAQADKSQDPISNQSIESRILSNQNSSETKTKAKPDSTISVIENGSAQKTASSESKAKEKQNTSDWNLLLVSSKHLIPQDFSVNLVQLNNGQAFDRRAYPDLQKMMDDARAAGLSPIICSSYRTMAKQTALYNRKVEQYKAQGYSETAAKTETGKWVAIPGTSEHQLGLAVDIISASNQMLDEQQEKTAEQIWLMKNSYKYGFILRYPAAKSKITGIGYEPWHYRYVGKEAAAEITQKGICLEEYVALNK